MLYRRFFALLMLLSGAVFSLAAAQGGVEIVVTSEFGNVRVLPALGAEVVASVPAGYNTIANARSPDNQWLRIDFNGQEGWLNITTLTVLSGDVNSLPVADPRTIPYGGFEAPRSGSSSATSGVIAVTRDWLRLRAGPSTGYPVLANIPLGTEVPLLGRTASNGWIQVAYEGVLGWVSIQYLEFRTPGFNVAQLPVDGVVADAPPRADGSTDTYVATLRLMLARVDLAQPTLDWIRAAWTDAAVTGRASCASAYPARPSDFPIPNEVLAANYGILEPLRVLFNDSMANVRRALDLFVEACNQPGGGNPVGQGLVSGALDVVILADSQFAELRRRLNDLIPADQEIGPDECLLVYNAKQDILSRITINTIYRDNLTSRLRVRGYCFDANAGDVLMVAVRQLPNSNVRAFVAVSPLDNPSNFIATGRAGSEYLSVAPVQITASARYVLIISDIEQNRDAALSGEFLFVVYNITTLNVLPELSFDPATGQAAITGLPADTGIPGTTPGAPTATPGGVVSCPSLSFTCNQLFSCAEAQACLNAGNFSLDPDADGVPCEENLCTGG